VRPPPSCVSSSRSFKADSPTRARRAYVALSRCRKPEGMRIEGFRAGVVMGALASSRSTSLAAVDDERS